MSTDIQNWPNTTGQFPTNPDSSPASVVEYQKDVVVTTTGDAGVIVPARVGKVFIVSRYTAQVMSVAGTCVVAPIVSHGTIPLLTAIYWLLLLYFLLQILMLGQAHKHHKISLDIKLCLMRISILTSKRLDQAQVDLHVRYVMFTLVFG